MYRVQRSTSVLLGNIMDQSHHLEPPNMFSEVGCDPAAFNMVYADNGGGGDGDGDGDGKPPIGAGGSTITRPFDRPVVFLIGGGDDAPLGGGGGLAGAPAPGRRVGTP